MRTEKVGLICLMFTLQQPLSLQAGTIYSIPNRIPDSEIREFLMTHEFDNTRLLVGFSFKDKGQFVGEGAGRARVNGTWEIIMNTVIVRAKGRGGYTKEGDIADQSYAWDASFQWRNLQIADGILLVLESNTKEKDDNNVFGAQEIWKCDNKNADDVKNELPCKPSKSPVIQIRPGNSRKDLFHRVVDHCRQKSGSDFILGEPTENIRHTTEIWYQGSRWEGFAGRLAADLRPLVGRISPKKWSWGGVYELIVIVGAAGE